MCLTWWWLTQTWWNTSTLALPSSMVRGQTYFIYIHIFFCIYIQTYIYLSWLHCTSNIQKRNSFVYFILFMRVLLFQSAQKFEVKEAFLSFILQMMNISFWSMKQKSPKLRLTVGKKGRYPPFWCFFESNILLMISPSFCKYSAGVLLICSKCIYRNT